jgi:hypothetical protein
VPYDLPPSYGGGYPGDCFPGDARSSFGTETFWVTGSFLHGWLSRPFLNGPLVTIGSINDPVAGALGQPSTVVAFGRDEYQFPNLNGARVEFGVNLTNRISLDFQGWVLGPSHIRSLFFSDATGSPFIARPVFNTMTQAEGSFGTSVPGLAVGATQIEAKQQLFGFEANARYQSNWTPYLTVDWLAGYKRVQLEEDLLIRDFITPIGGATSFIGDFDRFAATNQFNGGQIGTRFRWQSGFDWFGMTGYGKLALGATNQTVEIEGQSATVTAAGVQTATGGILALSSNIGHHKRQVFGVIPEAGVGIVLMPCRYVRLHAGYSALYWNDVLRPGDHIDRRVNPALVPTSRSFDPGAPRDFPAFTFRGRDVWLQTINFGLELYY